MLLDDCHIHMPWYLQGMLTNTMKLPWYTSKNKHVSVVSVICGFHKRKNRKCDRIKPTVQRLYLKIYLNIIVNKV